MKDEEVRMRNAPIIWKSKEVEAPCRDYDGEMKDVVRVLKTGDERSVESALRSVGNVNWKGADGNTLLHWAATLGHLCAVRLLLSAGADTDVANAVGATPLHCAAFCGSAEIIDELLMCGADAMAKNCKGHTMFDFLRDLWGDDLCRRYEGLEGLLSTLREGPYDHLSPPARLDEPPGSALASQKDFRGKVASFFLQNLHDSNSTSRLGSNHYRELRNFGDEELLQRYQQLEVKELLTEESERRNELVREHLTWVSDVTAQLKELGFPARCVEEVVEVLAKRDSPDGNRWLLLRAKGGARGSEVWVRLKDLCECYTTHVEDRCHVPFLRPRPTCRNLSRQCAMYGESNDDAYAHRIAKRVVQLLRQASTKAIHEREMVSVTSVRRLLGRYDAAESGVSNHPNSSLYMRGEGNHRTSESSWSTSGNKCSENSSQRRGTSARRNEHRTQQQLVGVNRNTSQHLPPLGVSTTPLSRHILQLALNNHGTLASPKSSPSGNISANAQDQHCYVDIRGAHASHYLRSRFNVQRKI